MSMIEKRDAALEQLRAAAETRDAAYQALEDADASIDTDALDELSAAFDEAQEQVERCKTAADKLDRIIEARDAVPTPKPAAKPKSEAVYVTRDEEVYRPDTRDYSFLSDVFRATFKSDTGARERLERNDRIVMETRDVTTGDPGAGSFVPPRYLGTLWQEKLRAERVVANLFPTFDLGSTGMSFTVPKVNTGVTVIKQAGENQNFSETDADSNTLTAYVETIGGLQDSSIQALERTDPAWQEVILDDLRRAYNEEVERQVLHGAGHGSNELPGILGVSGNIDVTWTETTPAGTTGLKKIYDCISQQGTNLVTSKVVAMHPRRSAWFASQTSTSFPIFQQGGLMQASGEQDNGYVGSIAGLPVYASPAILTTRGAGTNQDVIFVLDPAYIRFAEGTPRVEVFRDVLSQTGTVRIRLYNYAALIADRLPACIANIEGTGLATPSFA
jgi:HK97 family phage major capsid protein